MPGKRTAMRKIRDVLRLRLCASLSIREISRSTKLSVGGIQKLLAQIAKTRLLLIDDWGLETLNAITTFSSIPPAPWPAPNNSKAS